MCQDALESSNQIKDFIPKRESAGGDGALTEVAKAEDSEGAVTTLA